MPTYLHPGVYIEEIPSGVKTVEAVGTSTAAFVGKIARGPANEAVLIHSLSDYERAYGPLAGPDDAMGLALRVFYQNGGKDAYVTRLVSASPPAATSSATVDGQGLPAGTPVLRISAASVGPWGNDVFFRIKKPQAADLRFTLEVGHVGADGKFVADEIFAGVSMNAATDDYVLTRVNGASKLATVSLEPAADPAYQRGSLTSDEIDSTAAFFSTAMQDGMTMSLSLDGLGAKRITLPAKADLGLGTAPANKADGEAVAAAIESAVRALGPTTEPYQSFTSTYTHSATQHKIVLTSGSRSSSSSVEVLAGDGTTTDLARTLKLVQGTSVTPVAVHGSAKVIPVQVLGPFEQGTALAGGQGGDPTAEEYQKFFDDKLVKVRDVNFLVLPGQAMPSAGGNQAIAHAIAHCEATGSRMVIIDVAKDFELTDGGKVNQIGLSTSTYGALYYPWVKIANPFFNVDTNPTASPTLTIAPSAFAAGMWSKIDGRRGVWKAPAGVETQLLGVAGLEFVVEDAEQDQLNPLGVNALRKQPGFGHVIWGSRTLSTKANPEWRYVPVRRTAIFIEQSIYNGIQWAVFEGNDHRLWSSLRANIGDFMNGLFRSGAFQGEKASDAYFVRCGLGDTMTQADIDRGQVIVIVGFAPLKPAEFVIVRIQQKVAQQ